MAKVMTIRPPDNLRDALKRIAQEKGYTINQLVITILWDWYKHHQGGD